MKYDWTSELYIYIWSKNVSHWAYEKVKPRSPIAMKVVNSEVQLAISQSSRGLDLVACLEGQKINNTFLKLFVQPETQQLYNKASFNIYLARSL